MIVSPLLSVLLMHFRSPIFSEIMLLEKLDQIECEDANGEVETVCRELSTGEVIHVVMALQFSYHSFHFSALFMKVNNSVGIFLFLWNMVGCDSEVQMLLEAMINDLMIVTG